MQPQKLTKSWIKHTILLIGRWHGVYLNRYLNREGDLAKLYGKGITHDINIDPLRRRILKLSRSKIQIRASWSLYDGDKKVVEANNPTELIHKWLRKNHVDKEQSDDLVAELLQYVSKFYDSQTRSQSD